MSNNTDDSGILRDTRNWLRVESCIVAAFFLFVFVVGPYRRWQKNSVIKLLHSGAIAVSATLFSQITGMLSNYDQKNQLYLAWVVFLGVAQETSVGATAYSIYVPSTERIAFEIGVLTNSVYVAMLMSLFSFERFLVPLWGLWGFAMAKMIQRVLGFRAAARIYGPENVDLVAHLMSPEHEGKSIGDAPAVEDSAANYNYRVRGEDKVTYKYEEVMSRLTIKNKGHEEKVVTIDRIWDCEGRLLKKDGSAATRLKDVCLSFALFKLLRRRFRHYPPEGEAQRNKAKRLVLEHLLAQDEKNLQTTDDFQLRRHCSRTFRVVQVELEFLHDLFYTKYPISFHRGVSILNILQLFIIALSVWTSVWMFQGYYDKSSVNASWDNSKTDLIITYIATIAVILMEMWELITHLLSNWSKVLTTCDYVRHWRSRDRFHIDKLMTILGWCGSLWKPLNKDMGQYSLIEGYKTHSIRRNLYKVSTYVFGESEVGSGAKQFASAKVTRDVQYAIFQALREDNCCISNGDRSLQRNGIYSHLSLAASTDEKIDRKILIWHIATSYFELEMKAQNFTDKKFKSSNRIVGEERPYSHFQVAACLSRYCAYLLLFVPDLLPVNNLVAKLMFENVILDGADKIFSKDVTWWDKFRGKDTKKMYEKMKALVDSQNTSEEQTIMDEGLNLAKQLKSCVHDDETRWKVLAEFWAEFILFLAPSNNAEAHVTSLAAGGEFITHLWVLLYNAGIVERPGPSSSV